MKRVAGFENGEGLVDAAGAVERHPVDVGIAGVAGIDLGCPPDLAEGFGRALLTNKVTFLFHNLDLLLKIF